ncbi:MAG: phosphate ABC transporter substrate-binding protein PstS [Calothrix sp. SM1_5_4]|nr:phosphate ABC transporter substrate-binding protein PstS [Calothrix sp. SM1_5_4]
MRRLFVGLCGLLFSTGAFAAGITGAGATFVYPLMAKWADTYNKEFKKTVNYQSIGSGGGIKQIQAKTVDFGATDMPLKPEDLEKDGLVQFPIVNGAVVPVVRVAGIEPGKLKLTGPVLADIFLGKIKKWNAPEVVALNPELKLPDQAISVVRRSDGSGTTFIFSNYLSKVSSEWKSKVGEGTALSWPTGVGGKGNEGVASYVKQIDGSIGYVEYAYAIQNKMSYAQLKNKAGNFITPSIGSFETAAKSADWANAKNFNLILTDAAGKDSWPIAGSTFLLMHKTQANTAHAKEVLKFFRWALLKGQDVAKELHYVPLPDSVIRQIEKEWKDQIKSSDGTSIATGL